MTTGNLTGDMLDYRRAKQHFNRSDQAIRYGRELRHRHRRRAWRRALNAIVRRLT